MFPFFIALIKGLTIAVFHFSLNVPVLRDKLTILVSDGRHD